MIFYRQKTFVDLRKIEDVGHLLTVNNPSFDSRLVLEKIVQKSTFVSILDSSKIFKNIWFVLLIDLKCCKKSSFIYLKGSRNVSTKSILTKCCKIS